MRRLLAATGGVALALSLAAPAFAGEFYIGEPVVKNGLQIVPNYLLGIQMDRMVPGMEMGLNSIHLPRSRPARRRQ